MISGIHCNVFFSFKKSFIIPCVFFLSVHLLFIVPPSSFFPSVSLSLHLFRPEPASSSITIGVTSPPTLFLYALLFVFLILHLLLSSFSFIEHFEVSQILSIIICHIHFWKIILDSNLFPVLYFPPKKSSYFSHQTENRIKAKTKIYAKFKTGNSYKPKSANSYSLMGKQIYEQWNKITQIKREMAYKMTVKLWRE